MASNEPMTSRVASLRTLPFDILQTIISDLPFDVVVALIQTKDDRIIECIRFTASYKHVFKDIESNEDLEAVAEIIGLCYEISQYRYHTDALCDTFSRAAAAYNRTAWISHHDIYCWSYNNPGKCSSASQAPYHHGSVRGARWNRPSFFLNLETMQNWTNVPTPSCSGQKPQFSSRLDDQWRVARDTTSRWRHSIPERVSSKVHARLENDDVFNFHLTRKSDDMWDSITKLMNSTRERDAVRCSAVIEDGIEKFINGIKNPSAEALKTLADPFRKLLSSFEEVEFAATTYDARRAKFGMYYTLPMSAILDIFLEEILKDLVESLIAKFVIRALEERIHQVMKRAPISSYWFFRNYFTYNSSKPSLQNWDKLMFDTKDYKLFNDDQFWLENIQAAFRVFRSKQLIQLATLLDRYPHRLIKDIDPGSDARENVAHIKSNILSRARKLAIFNPYRRRQYREATSLMRCPGLPILPLKKHLGFFFDILAENPILLNEITSSAAVSRFLKLTSEPEGRLQDPGLTITRPQDQMIGAKLEFFDTGMYVATSKSNRLEDGNQSESASIGKMYDLQGEAEKREISSCISTTLCGFPQIYRTGMKTYPMPRLAGSYEGGTLDFTRWRNITKQHVELGPDEIAEPFHQKDIEWLSAFLECLEYFKSNFLSDTANSKVQERLSLFQPTEVPQEQKDHIKHERKKRKLERKKQQVHREATMNRKARHAAMNNKARFC